MEGVSSDVLATSANRCFPGSRLLILPSPIQQMGRLEDTSTGRTMGILQCKAYSKSSDSLALGSVLIIGLDCLVMLTGATFNDATT